MHTAYLLLGSNIGNSKAALQLAEKHIEEVMGCINKRSAFYRTAAWGNREQPDFLNRVIIIETTLTAGEILEKILKTEEQMGRTRSYKNAPRLIDIDILFFDDQIISTKDLAVPHPEIQNRRFVLEPLNEISPAFLHPVLHQTSAEMLAACGDRLNVQKI